MAHVVPLRPIPDASLDNLQGDDMDQALVLAWLYHQAKAGKLRELAVAFIREDEKDAEEITEGSYLSVGDNEAERVAGILSDLEFELRATGALFNVLAEGAHS